MPYANFHISTWKGFRQSYDWSYYSYMMSPMYSFNRERVPSWARQRTPSPTLQDFTAWKIWMGWLMVIGRISLAWPFFSLSPLIKNLTVPFIHICKFPFFLLQLCENTLFLDIFHVVSGECEGSHHIMNPSRRCTAAIHLSEFLMLKRKEGRKKMPVGIATCETPCE